MAFRFNQGDRPLPGYTIGRGVGRGGFGEVYYATSDGGKEVALKYLRENPQVELRGVQHCLNLKSPHLVAIHDIKQSPEGEHFVIMEYVSGPSLRDLLNSEAGGLGAQKAAYFLREIGKGLAYLHDRGIVHRDLKPGNIFYEDGYVKIGDYGLAKIMAASQHSGQTMSVGTVHYMAPEVGSGNYDRTIDIYALGVMLYEMLLGKVPFSGATMGEVLMKHLTAQPVVDELPAPFPNVIRKALAKDPKERYQTVQEMMAEVFAVGDINRSVAMIDSLSLTRMAAAAAKKIKVHGDDRGGGVATGSSSVTEFAPRGVTPPPPPVIPSVERGAQRGPQAIEHRLLDKLERVAPGLRDATETFPQRYRVTTGLLGLFLGGLGIHRFYTGHNRIGVLQLLASVFTGVGALWGIIEGLQILLNGNFRDALGRPLLESEWKSKPGGRSAAARALWGILAFVMFGGTIATACVATFAGPEMGLGISSAYWWDTLHGLYFVSSGMLGIFLFALWKAAHRGGMGFWRSTLRPGLMCAMVAVMGAGLTWELALAAGWVQLIGYFAVVIAAAVFAFAWLLRGPTMPVLEGDAYWHRAWARMFLVVAVVSTIGAAKTFHVWKAQDYLWPLGVGLYETQDEQVNGVPPGMRISRASRKVRAELDLPVVKLKVDASDDADGAAEDTEIERESAATANELSDVSSEIHAPAARARSYQVATLQYSHRPMAVWLLALLAIGSFGESRSRRHLAMRALEIAAKD